MSSKGNDRKGVRDHPPARVLSTDDIIERVRNTDVIPPGELAELRLKLSAEYGLISSELQEVLMRKPDKWLEYRQTDGITTDKLADRLWDASPDGKFEVSARMMLKRIDKMLSGLSQRLRTYENEAKNRY